MKLAYLDCAAGIAGDMCLGALIDCGVPLDYLQQQLDLLGLQNEYVLQAQSVLRGGQRATHVTVEVLDSHPHAHHSKHDHAHHSDHHHPHARHWRDIQQLIHESDLPPLVKERSLKIFFTLAKAEATVHALPIEAVHFHEVGAVDALVDVVGTCIGLDWLKVEQVISSPHPIGGGWVEAEHGRMSVPVPAVMQLWETFHVPVMSNGVEAELVTPTGAAIAVALAEQFGSCPAMRLLQVGRGAGTRELPIANVLRVWIGDSSGSDLTEPIAVLETQIDDLNPQVIAYTFERLMDAGAVDVFTQSITMKQGRPATLLTVICPPDQVMSCEGILFRETTTLGIRKSLQQRTLLPRTFTSVNTPYGSIAIKVASRYGQEINAQPEFRECAELARQLGIPVQTIWLAAHSAWESAKSGSAFH